MEFSEFILKGFLEANVKEVEKHFSKKLAYHNLEHCVQVGTRAYNLAEKYDIKDSINFLIAGLWHDVDHSGDENLEDSINIENSVKLWKEFGHSLNARLFWNTGAWIELKNLDKIEELIRATQWPYYNLSETTSGNNLRIAIMRNADLEQIFSQKWTDNVNQEQPKWKFTVEQRREFGKNFMYDLDKIAENKN